MKSRSASTAVVSTRAARARIGAGAAAAGLALIGAAALTPGAARAANDGAFVLTAHATTAASHYAPTFTGNGLLGVRVPAAGQGYAGGTVPADSELAGFYAQPSRGTASERVQQRANLPTWSSLGLTVAGTRFSAQSATVSGYRQSLDLHTGIVTTHARWTAPGGRVTDVTYQVLTDRARANVGLVRLTLTPMWTGTATVTDAIDGTPDTHVPTGSPVLTRQAAKSWNLPARSDELTVAALGTGIQATVASVLAPSADITAPSTAADAGTAQSVAQTVRFPVTRGRTYRLTKYVGVQDSDQPTARRLTAAQAAADAATTGWNALLAANRQAWAKLWQGRIDVAGDPTIATDVNASQFYLWSSTRAGQDWSISPAGLSSNGYDGHIFWDAETWMFPSLLAQHPDLADAMETYRDRRLPEARAHARATGARGARFPWESALKGTEQIPPPVSNNSEGLYEQHITADIALAQWQYWLATGDRQWLTTRGWPTISGAAQFWASRARRSSRGRYVIDHITGPDEENPNVSNEAYTQVAAATTLQIATAAARLTGHRAPASWPVIARGLERSVPVSAGSNPEFAGYRDQLVKQADVTLLAYPWGFRASAAVERADLNFYVPRTDPGGPSMDDAVSSIESAQLSPASCQAYVYTERSEQPFIRDVFHQFSETRTGGAFTFMTGIGGFLQEFLYGYSGMRWQPGALRLAPSLSGSISGVTLHDLHWRGRVFTLAIARGHATVTLQSGPALPLTTPGGRATVHAGHPTTIRSRATSTANGSDALSCGAARASSTALGAPALAAVDGSPATDWQPSALPATLTAPLARTAELSRVTVRWGRMWPATVTPNVHPKPEPVHTVRSRDYTLLVQTAGGRWRKITTVAGTGKGVLDTITFPRVRARAVRLALIGGSGVRTVKTSSTPSAPVLPMVQELTAGG